MIRELPARPVVAEEPIGLPLNVLMAFGQDATTYWKQPLFDATAAAELLLGSRENVDKVLRPRIWAKDWAPDQFRAERVGDFLGIEGDVEAHQTRLNFDVVHCVSAFGLRYPSDPYLVLPSIQVGRLRDALVESRTRLLILQTREEHLRVGMLPERMAEFIAGAGGPAVLVVAGPEMELLNRYVVDVYAAILRNQPLDDVARLEIPGSRILLVHGENGSRLLQFDGLIERLGKRLLDYSSLLGRLRTAIRDWGLSATGEETTLLERLHPRVNEALRALVDLKARGWGESTREVVTLGELTEAVEAINRDIGWTTGEGPLHTKFDMLEYRLSQAAFDRRRGWIPEQNISGAPKLSELSPASEAITVFFGTNRSKAADGIYYGTDRDSMHYGRCLVNVPSHRPKGTIPRPSIWTLYRADAAKHFLVQGIAEDNRTEFANNLRQYIGDCTSKDALLFIHGFNVDFVSAVFRAAQITADLRFPGASLLFSWPSKGSWTPLAYTHDETQARWTLPDLRQFLELVAEQSGAETIHLLAHSMGNRALTEALGRLGAAVARRSGTIFNEVMLTAPDIDTDTFVRDIAPEIVPTAKRVTLYASSNDKALAFSKTIHGYDRVGESGDKIVLLDGIETIDVSSIDTNLVGHFYYGDNRSVLSDIFYLIQGQPAGKRFGLKQRTKDRRLYWVFQP